jgi:hypothetical protein
MLDASRAIYTGLWSIDTDAIHDPVWVEDEGYTSEQKKEIKMITKTYTIIITTDAPESEINGAMLDSIDGLVEDIDPDGQGTLEIKVLNEVDDVVGNYWYEPQEYAS